ncbi:aminoglycoside 6'-N-acetyltransferase [Paenibacillus cellulosilyticus]|uniref:Aminoglycoside 6'-N-acetyltransferase n=1 Tax=Paenibacillus cellulosilyticus TaxID=375489 RepID=A0A2V2YQ11_9BACL|nr:GNAT family N-acetyltransferase [Paenibacillus cellulosilyticus]PWV94531.1 aminoglycoside 6'-N-acetyltransferase [Paenibacillus cellulosilyticus]QKS45035.1 acetyltransferase [Paenibacillus cellulosilyticus]
MVLYQQDQLTVRRLELDDAQLLVRWLSDPVVLEFYEGRDRPHDHALVMEHFYRGDDDEEVRCIVEFEEEAIGYIQFYPLDDEDREEYGYQDVVGDIYGMDQFIGEPRFWNRGVGTKLVQATVQYLFREKEAAKVIMDPQTWNTRALRVYDKCRFNRVKLLESHEWHEGEMRDCWLIERNQPLDS